MSACAERAGLQLRAGNALGTVQPAAQVPITMWKLNSCGARRCRAACVLWRHGLCTHEHNPQSAKPRLCVFHFIPFHSSSAAPARSYAEPSKLKEIKQRAAVHKAGKHGKKGVHKPKFQSARA